MLYDQVDNEAEYSLPKLFRNVSIGLLGCFVAASVFSLSVMNNELNTRDQLIASQQYQYEQVIKEKSDLKVKYEKAKAPKAEDDDILYMALTMWGEARNLGEEGMREVGKTILARAQANEPGRWGYGIIGVTQHYKQFSCWNPWDANYPKLRRILNDPSKGDKEFALAMEIAMDLIAENPEDGFYYYHTNDIRPYWVRANNVEGLEIGGHTFYRERAL